MERNFKCTILSKIYLTKRVFTGTMMFASHRIEMTKKPDKEMVLDIVDNNEIIVNICNTVEHYF